MIPGDFVMVGLFLKAQRCFSLTSLAPCTEPGPTPRLSLCGSAATALASASSGDMRLLGDILTDIVGRRVLLVDDIVDTCRSIAFAVALPRQRKIGEIWMCALLDKPERREVDASLDFVGVRIGDVFVASYGIDHAEKYGHLPTSASWTDTGPRS